MNYTENELKEMRQKNGFRLRGIEITRLETFMDAAFAFAMTMLVISVGEIPKNYFELMSSLKEIPAFLLSFFVIMLFWLSHRTWSRRYGLEDGVTIALSISLIFVLLVYIYPLRLMFSALFSWISNGWFPSKFEVTATSELVGLFSIYGFGLFAIAGIISLLYLRAYQKTKELQLNALERHETKKKVVSLAVVSITGFVLACLSLLLPTTLAMASVALYASLPISMALVRVYFKRIKNH